MVITIYRMNVNNGWYPITSGKAKNVFDSIIKFDPSEMGTYLALQDGSNDPEARIFTVGLEKNI